MSIYYSNETDKRTLSSYRRFWSAHYIVEEIWCLVTYLNVANHHATWITKADKDFANKFDFEDIKLLAKIRHIHKIDKNNSISISVSGCENKEKHPLYVSKQFCRRQDVDLFLKGEGDTNTMFLSKILIRSCMITHYFLEEKCSLVKYLNPANIT